MSELDNFIEELVAQPKPSTRRISLLFVSNKKCKETLKKKAIQLTIVLSVIITSFLVIALFATLTINSLPLLFNEKISIFSLTWHPPGGKFGIFTMLYGTAVVSCIALLLACPIGMLSAITISEYLPKKHAFQLSP